MNKNLPVILEKIDNFFYCSIPELKLVIKSEDLNEAYEKIQLMKDERLKSSEEYDSFCVTGKSSYQSTENLIKKIITILFFLLLAIGIISHFTNTLVDNLARKADQLDITKPLRKISALSPQEKAEKVKRFQVKMESAQELLKDAKPFIEVSKPFLKDLQESFDLKNTRP